jgi:hypothetical protein
LRLLQPLSLPLQLAEAAVRLWNAAYGVRRSDQKGNPPPSWKQVFTGQDCVDWLYGNLQLESRADARALASALVPLMYIENVNLTYGPELLLLLMASSFRYVRDDPSSFYRFNQKLLQERSKLIRGAMPVEGAHEPTTSVSCLTNPSMLIGAVRRRRSGTATGSSCWHTPSGLSCLPVGCC